jgi:hypothetical protein
VTTVVRRRWRKSSPNITKVTAEERCKRGVGEMMGTNIKRSTGVAYSRGTLKTWWYRVWWYRTRWYIRRLWHRIVYKRSRQGSSSIGGLTENIAPRIVVRLGEVYWRGD